MSVQSVSATNSRYYEPIRFHQKTGLPIILNTSLTENAPSAHTPAQAIECYLRTEIDVIVLENFWMKRK